MTTTRANSTAIPQDASSCLPPRTPRLTLPHLLGFLLGRRESIMAAAGDRSAFWIGMIFVFSAALAREYDGEDLRREPWHLLIPLLASLVVSIPLFALVRRTDVVPRRRFVEEYRAFLTLFWLTAPLALLYGIPYERFLSPLGAVVANLWTLGLVAAWRVALMTRVVSIVTGRSAVFSFFLVMLVADAFAAVAMMLVPLPVLQLMGGIRLTESEHLLQGVGFSACVLSVVSLPAWLIAGALARWGEDVPAKLAPIVPASPTRAAKGPLALAAVCVLVWAGILPATQREQRRRSDAERMLRTGQIATALAEMSRHERGDYPPAWDPPPRIGWPEAEMPRMLDVMRVIAAQPTADWVRAAYLDKFERRQMGEYLDWESGSLPAVLSVLDALPEGPALREKYAGNLLRAQSDAAREDEPVPATTGSATQAATTRGAP